MTAFSSHGFTELKFSVNQTLWELWTFLERHGIDEVFVEEDKPSSHPDYVEVAVEVSETVVRRVVIAILKFPKEYLGHKKLVKIFNYFADTYNNFHIYLRDISEKHAGHIRILAENLQTLVIPPSPPLRGLEKDIVQHIIYCLGRYPHNLPEKLPYTELFDYAINVLYHKFRG